MYAIQSSMTMLNTRLLLHATAFLFPFFFQAVSQAFSIA